MLMVLGYYIIDTLSQRIRIMTHKEEGL
jgi:hypothetical protein